MRTTANEAWPNWVSRKARKEATAQRHYISLFHAANAKKRRRSDLEVQIKYYSIKNDCKQSLPELGFTQSAQRGNGARHGISLFHAANAKKRRRSDLEIQIKYCLIKNDCKRSLPELGFTQSAQRGNGARHGISLFHAENAKKRRRNDLEVQISNFKSQIFTLPSS
ncbi:hypothetical protein QTN47_03090 [Danxiaibacter flavus]|uniref:Uncharacterized protein n=1 Tax=Danxiaibacter flavus TaxID=3049108 RepID=A0ABV3ZAF2_9BACT|nr:hypothetical protein QNM32_03090 [Chitinophagaceae bacterium DXS]